MTADDTPEGFLSRWSRLKREPAPSREGPEEQPVAAPAPVAKAPAAPDDRKERIDPAELPPIDSLTAESDFTAFLREGVPDALRRQALRKLWVSDPVIAATDVLDVYNLDYFNMPSFPDGVKTVFRVGRGMLDEAEQAAEKEAAAQAAAAQAEKPAAESPAEGEAPKSLAASSEPEDGAALQQEEDVSSPEAIVTRPKV